MTSYSPVARPGARLFWVDWARFLAALAVVLSHIVPDTLVAWESLPVADRGPTNMVLYAIGSFGQEAVLIFFVLSGYLVGGKVYERVKAGSFDFRKYAIDRVTRIYVPLLPAAALSAFVWWWLGRPVDLGQLALNLVQMQGVLCKSYAGNGVFWTLAYEVWFYVLGGAVGAALTLRGTPRVIGIAVTIGVLALFTKLEPVYLGCWLIGAAASTLSRRPLAGWVRSAGLVLLVGSLCALSPYGIPGRNTAAHHLAFLLMSAGCGLLMVTMTRNPPRGFLASIETMGPRLADSSYTLYLVHVPVLLALAPIFPSLGLMPGWSAMLAVLAKAAAALVLAWLFYLPFERQTAVVRALLMRHSSQRP